MLLCCDGLVQELCTRAFLTLGMGKCKSKVCNAVSANRAVGVYIDRAGGLVAESGPRDIKKQKLAVSESKRIAIDLQGNYIGSTQDSCYVLSWSRSDSSRQPHSDERPFMERPYRQWPPIF